MGFVERIPQFFQREILVIVLAVIREDIDGISFLSNFYPLKLWRIMSSGRLVCYRGRKAVGDFFWGRDSTSLDF